MTYGVFSPIESNLGHNYYVLFIDDYSFFAWLYPLKLKSDFYDTFIQFKKFVENQYSSRIIFFEGVVVQNLLVISLQLTFIPRVSIINYLAIYSCPKWSR